MRQIFRVTEIRTVALHTSGSSVWNLFHIIRLAQTNYYGAHIKKKIKFVHPGLNTSLGRSHISCFPVVTISCARLFINQLATCQTYDGSPTTRWMPTLSFSTSSYLAENKHIVVLYAHVPTLRCPQRVPYIEHVLSVVL